MLLLAIAGATSVSRAQTVSMLYHFANNGDGPSAFYNPGVLAQGQDGNVSTTGFARGFSTDPMPRAHFSI
jgi:hypothetical protein